MPLIRSDRTDRRRRVMREAAAADAGVAVESVRAAKRRRMRESQDSSDSFSTPKRDPGYSQAVRRACQQRLVQLIPVRRRSLMFTIAGLWMIWSTLMLAHYFAHVQPIGKINTLPIAYLLHMRSTHGIAHWLGGQLWTLTALASLMIFQLRRHKLDDYRAKYRVWGLLAIAAIISSLDVSSSGLQLLGMSIDTWARREVGYSGWAVVLATFATLVGILGLRICSEIKSAPLSVVFWLCGLIAWAMSALIGTELMNSPWNKTTTDMVVGGAWLGGILSVFLAGGIYLRHIYIQAQKRFILRNGMLATGQAWKLPRFARRGRSESDQTDESDESVSQAKSTKTDVHPEPREPRSWLPWKRPSWFRLPRWKSDPRLGDDFSDVSAERRKRDEGFEEPLTKRSGWFTRKPAVVQEKKEKAQDRDSDRQSNRQDDRRDDRRQTNTSSYQRDDAREDSMPDFKEIPPQRSTWWKRSPKAEKSVKKKERTSLDIDAEAAQTQRRRWFRRTAKPRTATEPSSGQPKLKKPWGLLKKRNPSDERSDASTSNTPKTASDKPKRKLFGFFDNLKLKPPTVGNAKTAPVPVSSGRAPVPSSSTAQRHETTKVDTSYSDSRQSPEIDEEEYEDDGNRSLSKAERKRLRRQQQENRRAA